MASSANCVFDGVEEYLTPALMKGLNDLDPYVKKTAVIACIKLFHVKKRNIDASMWTEGEDYVCVEGIKGLNGIHQITENFN